MQLDNFASDDALIDFTSIEVQLHFVLHKHLRMLEDSYPLSATIVCSDAQCPQQPNRSSIHVTFLVHQR